MSYTSIPLPVFKRMTTYLFYLKHLPKEAPVHISATSIAEAVGLNHVQVRKDLAIVSDKGKPKVGYKAKELIKDIENFLGYNDTREAVLVGVGNLGRALLSYDNLKSYGLEIVAAFDNSPAVIGTEVCGIKVLSVDQLANLCRRLNVKIGIITVPAEMAQEVCDRLVAGEALGIWNFAPAHLTAPEPVIIQNEDMASSLAVLTNRMAESIAALAHGGGKE